MNSFKPVDHTADWAIEVWGKDLSDLFTNAALGMGTLLAGDLTAVPLNLTRPLEVTGYDVETLLVEWLTELAYWAETEQLIFQQIDIKTITPTHLVADLCGGQAVHLEKHIKAVTYHNLAVKETAVGLKTTIVFDV